MARMLKKTKRYGRCSVQGHGANCIVAEELQSVEWTITKYKRRWKKDLERELEEMEKEKNQKMKIFLDR